MAVGVTARVVGSGPILVYVHEVVVVRIAVSISDFAPREGGAERQLRQVLQELDRRLFQTLVVAQNNDGLPAHSLAGDISVVRVGRRRGRSFAVSKANALLSVGLALPTLARFKPDVIVCSQLNSATFAAASLRGFLESHSSFVLAGGSATGSETEVLSRQFVRRRIYAPIVRRSTSVVAPANHLFDGDGLLTQYARERAVIIPNGVITNLSPPPNSNKKNSDVVWVGRDHEVKGVTVSSRSHAYVTI